jgi:transposase
MTFDNIEPGRWHDRAGSSSSKLHTLYGTPRAWFRRSIDASRLTAADLELFNRDEVFIRTAAIFHRYSKIDINTLLGSWANVYWPRKGHTCAVDKDWFMIIASPEDMNSWLEQAYHLGARAWYKNDDSTPPWHYEPIERETDPDLDRRKAPSRVRETGIKGGYNQTAMIADIKARYLSYTEIADKYEVSKTTVSRIALKVRPMTPMARIKQQLEKTDTDAIAEDIKSNKMTKSQIAKKYGVDLYVVTKVQKACGMTGKMTFYKTLTKTVNGGRHRMYEYDEAQIVEDLRNAYINGWRRQDIADRHNIKLSTLNGIQAKYGLVGVFGPVGSRRREEQVANKKAP